MLTDRAALARGGCRVEVPGNCRGIRLDPVEGANCLVRGMNAATADGEALGFTAKNGERLGDYLLFLGTVDPQIHIEGDFDGVREIVLGADIRCLTPPVVKAPE